MDRDLGVIDMSLIFGGLPSELSSMFPVISSISWLVDKSRKFVVVLVPALVLYFIVVYPFVCMCTRLLGILLPQIKRHLSDY